MRDFLVDHAIKNVWCTPDQDRQLIIEPAKISPFDGVLNTANILNRRINLPLRNVRFHIYQIGNIDPIQLGLTKTRNIWFTIASACNSNKTIVDIYANSGLQLPRIHVWYMILTDGNLILAVKTQPKININFNTESIFIRTYSNSYFASDRSDALNDFISVKGGVLNTTNEIVELQTKFEELSVLAGTTYAFVNGYKVAGVDLISVVPGDVVEYVYDSSIERVIDLPISQLPTFISSLDNKSKYLIHYTDNDVDTIHYLDDVDFFIIKPLTNNRHIGLYYHKNTNDSVRMVTHRDYSLVVSYLVGYMATNSEWTGINDFTVRLHIRKSGYDRSLILENNRINELYKLPNTELVNAMIGANSTVHNWTADTLESSTYLTLMGTSYAGINRQLVENAYGYNSISKILGNTPVIADLSSGLPIANVPDGLVELSIMYEYDDEGLLLEWHQHQFGNKYYPHNSNCRLVEMVAGIGTTNIDEVYSGSDIILDPDADYRFYICPIINGNPTYAWVDVTNTNKYQIVDNVLMWLVSDSQYLTLVRSNKHILAYDLFLIADDGLVSFDLTSKQLRDNKSSVWKMTVPMGELDIILNGYSLIEGIDYVFNFPEVIIINKIYLKDVLTKPQKITVRYSGFCNADLKSDSIIDRGFIEYGLLSHNSQFNLRDDKVLRIVVGGQYYSRDELLFAENNNGITIPNPKNGIPYSIRDVIVPLRGVGTVDTYLAKRNSLAIDKLVSDYLTNFLPEPILTTPNVIENLYTIYSPFCCKIIYDLKAGYIDDPRLMEHYTDEVVMELVSSYERILKFDPTKISTLATNAYIKIHPHNLPNVVDLNIYQYKFISRVIKIYMPDLIQLSEFVSVTS